MHANMQAAGYYLDYSVMQLSGVVSNCITPARGLAQCRTAYLCINCAVLSRAEKIKCKVCASLVLRMRLCAKAIGVSAGTQLKLLR